MQKEKIHVYIYMYEMVWDEMRYDNIIQRITLLDIMETFWLPFQVHSLPFPHTLFTVVFSVLSRFGIWRSEPMLLNSRVTLDQSLTSPFQKMGEQVFILSAEPYMGGRGRGELLPRQKTIPLNL